jgi:hypothetical protein
MPGTASSSSFSRNLAALSLSKFPPLSPPYLLSFPTGETTAGTLNLEAVTRGLHCRPLSISTRWNFPLAPLGLFLSPLSLACHLTPSSLLLSQRSCTPATSEPTADSSRLSGSPREALAIADQVSELSVLFCFASATPSPSWHTGASSPLTISAAPRRRIASPVSNSPLIFPFPRIQIQRPGLEASTESVPATQSLPCCAA